VGAIQIERSYSVKSASRTTAPTQRGHAIAAKELHILLLVVFVDDEWQFASVFLVNQVEPIHPLVLGLYLLYDSILQDMGNQVYLRMDSKELCLTLDDFVKLSKKPCRILQMNPERRFLAIRFSYRGETVLLRPRCPERLVALVVLVRNVVRFRIFKNKAIETSFQNPPDEGPPIVFQARSEGESFGYRALCIAFTMLLNIRAIVGVLPDVGVHLNATHVRVLDYTL